MPYECHMCLKKFRQKQGLNAHVKANRCQMGAIRASPRSTASIDSSTDSTKSVTTLTVKDIQSIAAQVTAKVNDFKVENVLTIEAIKKLTSSPMTIKVNNKKHCNRSNTPDHLNEHHNDLSYSNICDESPPSKQQNRPIDLSLLSNGFTNFLKKVESHPNNCETPSDLTLPAIGPSLTARKEINTSLSEMEKNQIIKDVKHVVCRRSRRKQGMLLRNCRFSMYLIKYAFD